jgi:O-antigen ligase
MDTLPAIFIFLGILFVFSAILWPSFGLVIYTGFLYLRPAQLYPLLAPYHVTRIIAIAVIIGFLLHMALKKNKFVQAKQTWILLGLLFVIIISFSTGWIQLCLERFEQMLKNVIAYLLIINLIDTKRKLRFFIWALMVFSAILAWDTIQQYLQLGPLQALDIRLGGFSGGYFGGAGDFAIMMNIMVPFAFFSMLGERKFILKIISILLLGLFTYGMVVTFARGGGVITFCAAMIVILMISFKSRGVAFKFISSLVIGGLIVGLVVLTPSQFKERSSSILRYRQEGTGMRRIEYWKLGVKMFLAYPLTGVGAGNYPVRYNEFGGWERRWRVSHNMFVDAAAELGIGGISLLLALLFITLRDNWRMQKSLNMKKQTRSYSYYTNLAVFASIITYCVGGIFQSVLYYPMLYFLIAIAIVSKRVSEKIEVE